MIVETDDHIVSDENCSPDVGPPTHNPSGGIVYNDSTQMDLLIIFALHIHFNAPTHTFYATYPT